MVYKYNYIIIPLHFSYVKLGFWNGSISNLKSRYQTYYGDFEFYVYQCVDNKDNEKYIFSLLKEYNYKGELYDKKVIPKFFEILELVSLKYTNSIDLEHNFIKLRNGYIKNKIIENTKNKIKNDIKIIDYKKVFNKVIKEISLTVKITKSKVLDCSLYDFLLENTRYKENNVILLETVKSKFNDWLGKKVTKLDNRTFFQVNKDYIIESIKICKHCNKDSKKGCCEKYKYTDRTVKKIVKNLIFLD
jgi:transcriptional regulator with PAS, ATPase and Fis domain